MFYIYIKPLNLTVHYKFVSRKDEKEEGKSNLLTLRYSMSGRIDFSYIKHVKTHYISMIYPRIR